MDGHHHHARRRGVLGVGTGVALSAWATAAAAQPTGKPRPDASRTLSAAAFGAVGDGNADDTAAIQAALDAAFAPAGPGFLVIPPGRYKITRTLRIARKEGAEGNVVRHSGIIAHGAQLVSAITNGANVFEFVSRSVI